MMAEVAVMLAEQYHDQVGVVMAYIDDNKMEPFLKSHGVSVYDLHCHKYSPLLPFRYARIIRKGKYEVVHTNHSFSQIFGGFATLLVSGKVRFFMTEHSLDSVRRRHAWFRPVDRFCYKRYNRVFAVSDCVKQRLISWLGNEFSGRIDVISNGVDSDSLMQARPANRSDLGCRDGDILICSISRLVPSKDLPTLLRAVSLLPAHYRAVIVGDGTEQETLQNLASELGVNSRVVFTGRRTDIGSILKASDIYVSSSLSEGFGLTIIEASICGLPIVASDIPAFRELLTQRQLFSPGDAQTLAERIMEKNMLPVHKDFKEKYSLLQMAANYHKAMASHS